MTPKNSYAKEELVACGHGDLFGPGNAQLPTDNMLMMNRITRITAEGGDHGKGEIIAELAGRGIRLSMASNGYGLNHIADWQLQAFHDVEVSIDFASEEQQDRFRGAGNWRDVHAAMERCKALAIDVSILTTLMSVNYDQMPDLVELARSVDANLRVNVYQSVQTDAYSLSYAQFWRAFKELFAVGKLVSCTEPVVRAALERAGGGGDQARGGDHLGQHRQTLLGDLGQDALRRVADELQRDRRAADQRRRLVGVGAVNDAATHRQQVAHADALARREGQPAEDDRSLAGRIDLGAHIVQRPEHAGPYIAGMLHFSWMPSLCQEAFSSLLGWLLAGFLCFWGALSLQWGLVWGLAH